MPTLTYQPPSFLHQQIKANEWSPEWMAARAKINWKSAQSNNSFTANIRLRRDSVLWISISALLGVEAARVLITKDSIKIADKFNKKLIVKDFSFLQNYLPYDMNFTLLERILLGNTIFYNKENLSSGIQDNLYVLTSVTGPIRHDLYLNADNRITKSMMRDTSNHRQMTIDFSGHREIAGRYFAHKRHIEILKEDTISIEVDFEKIRVDEPLDFPFKEY